MAKGNTEVEEVVLDEGGEVKKKKPLLPIIIILLVLAGAGGGAAWYFMQSGSGGEHGGEKAKAAPPVFERLDTFTVNLGGSADRYLQVEMSLKVADPQVGEDIKARMPEVRNSLLLILSSKNAEELTTVEGKTKLSNEIVQKINALLGVTKPGEGVLGVLFTSFIIQ